MGRIGHGRVAHINYRPEVGPISDPSAKGTTPITKCSILQRNLSRREFSIAAGLFALPWSLPIIARAAEPQTLDARFEFLSNHGNSTCSAVFTDSISKMPVTARLQGSCCSPMDRHRYGEQVQALRKYSAINPARSL